MKAAIFEALNRPLRATEVDDPVPERNQLLLKVCRCGICGSDLHITQDPVFGARAGDVLGHEISGEVLEVGPEVQGLRPGDLVSVAPLAGCGQCDACRRGEPAWCSQFRLTMGGYAQYAALLPQQCRKLPADVSLADAALAEPLAVALHGVQRAGLQPAQRVAVVGAGAIGLAVAYWARRLGAIGVAVLDLLDHQRERALDLGATAFLATAGMDAAEQSARLDEALGGPPDTVFECVGRPGLIDHCIGLVRPRGTVAVLGLCTAPDHFDAFRAISKEVQIAMSVFFGMPEFERTLDALNAGQAAPLALVSGTVGLDAMPEAFEALRVRSGQCKVLVDPFG